MDRRLIASLSLLITSSAAMGCTLNLGFGSGSDSQNGADAGSDPQHADPSHEKPFASDGKNHNPPDSSGSAAGGSGSGSGCGAPAGDAPKPPDSAASCPKHAIAIIEGDAVTCMFKGFEIPNTDRIAPYCNWVQLGYVGFEWPLEDVGDDEYACPQGSAYTSDDSNWGTCLFYVDPMPANAASLRANCDALGQGMISYSFR
jgi:hypothetical protein